MFRLQYVLWKTPVGNARPPLHRWREYHIAEYKNGRCRTRARRGRRASCSARSLWTWRTATGEACQDHPTPRSNFYKIGLSRTTESQCRENRTRSPRHRTRDPSVHRKCCRPAENDTRWCNDRNTAGQLAAGAATYATEIVAWQRESSPPPLTSQAAPTAASEMFLKPSSLYLLILVISTHHPRYIYQLLYLYTFYLHADANNKD